MIAKARLIGQCFATAMGYGNNSVVVELGECSAYTITLERRMGTPSVDAGGNLNTVIHST